ncbi:MAG: acetyl-CoA decarbonylase/synthase complex subunit delta [Bacillota bacterium]|nr:acetyl-CoA decarbonylase/synthase complex subunit delta [Bacillota bacterium]
MKFEWPVEKWPARICSVTIGPSGAEAGGGKRSVTVGGEGALPFLALEGPLPHRPALALEVRDELPDWPQVLRDALGPSCHDPVAWARRCEEEWGAELICLRLSGASPEGKNKGVSEVVALVRDLSGAIQSPLIILGCGDVEKDNALFPKVAEALAGQRCLLGPVTKDNYKTIAAAAMANGHSLIAQSPVDVNMQKQICILLEEVGVKQERIVLDPTTGGLGYGLEYTYSVMERIRLAALQGERNLASPIIVFPGSEAWRAKEAAQAARSGGPVQGVVWELLTASTLAQAGADLLVLLDPRAAAAFREHLGRLWKGGEAA